MFARVTQGESDQILRQITSTVAQDFHVDRRPWTMTVPPRSYSVQVFQPNEGQLLNPPTFPGSHLQIADNLWRHLGVCSETLALTTE